jgi:hypothetical protein
VGAVSTVRQHRLSLNKANRTFLMLQEVGMKSNIPVLDFDDPAMRTLAGKMVRNARGRCHFQITQCKAARTLAQNSYYWGVVLPAVSEGIAEAWGESLSIEETHELCRRAFLSRPVVDRNSGEVKSRVPQSTTKLDTASFAEYLERIIKFAAEQLGAQIPEATREHATA